MVRGGSRDKIFNQDISYEGHVKANHSICIRVYMKLFTRTHRLALPVSRIFSNTASLLHPALCLLSLTLHSVNIVRPHVTRQLINA